MTETAEPAASLNDLVERCTQAWEVEGPAALDRLCAEHPALASGLRRRIDILLRSGLLLGDAPPRRLGDFTLERELGSGGMGTVFAATQVSLGRRVALKVIRADQSLFAAARQRFLREAEAIARLQHPGIVPVHVAGEHEGVLYYAMELVEGCTLAQALARLRHRDPASLSGDDLRAAVAPRVQGAPPHDDDVFRRTWVETCLRIAQRLAEALEHAHARGVLHRDVKPSNIMLTPGGRVLLLDFGLASAEGDPRITRTGTIVGSLAYMAPEQVRGEAERITRQTDVYALGLVLYEMLTLAQPFLESTSERTRQAVLASRPPAPRTRNRAVAVDVELVCLTAMDPEHERRYASAQAFAVDVGNVLALRPIVARALPLSLRLRRAARRHPTGAVSVVFAAVLLLGVFPALWLQQRAAARALRVEQGRTAAALREEQAARARAQAEEERARFGLAKAREAVDRFLAQMGQYRAADVPLLEELRRATLQDALALYEQLLADPGAATPELRAERQRTRFGLVSVLRDLGRTAEVEPILVELLGDLGAPQADDPPRRRLLRAQANSVLGTVRWAQGALDRVEAPLVAAQEELRALQGEALPELAVTLLRNATRLALLRASQQRHEEAEALFDEALAAAASDDDLEVMRVRADALAGLADLHHVCSRVDAAVDCGARAVEVRRTIVARAPASARFRHELASALESNGLVLRQWRSTAHPDALRLLVEAAAIRAGLARDFPQQIRFQVDVSRSLLGVASLRIEMGDETVAEGDIREAIRLLNGVRAAVPEERTWRAPLGFAHYTLAELLQQLGRTDDAAAETASGVALARDLVAADPADTTFQQQLAEILGARARWQHVAADEGLALAREAFELGRGFLLEHADDALLRGTAFRCFDVYATLLAEASDPVALVALADRYRDANPYKWASQLALGRTYLRAAAMPGADPALRERCREEAIATVERAARHMAQPVLRIESDAAFAPILQDPRVQAVLAAARSAGG